MFSAELRQTLHNLLGECYVTVIGGDVNITEPSVDANSDEIVSKKSKIDLSPPATPPKRPAPEVRSCDLAHMITIIITSYTGFQSTYEVPYNQSVKNLLVSHSQTAFSRFSLCGAPTKKNGKKQSGYARLIYAVQR